MIFKITEKDLNTLGKALEEALLHTDYNSECFSCSDIRHAEAFNNDICRVFSILCDNSINIVKYMGKEFKKRFKGYFSESDFEKIQTPDEFEILLYSDAIWRVSDELLKLKDSNERTLKIESEHFTKYWTVLTHGCIYSIAPTKDSLIAFSDTCESLKNVLHFILPEIENSQIKNIRAVYFNKNELELEVQYVKESREYALYVFEDDTRADIVISSNGVAIKIYPTSKGSQISLIFKNDDFCEYYKKIQEEECRLNEMTKKILNEKLENIDKDSDKFSKLDHETLDGEIYQYWVCLNDLSSLKNHRNELDEDGDDIYLCDIEERIYYKSNECVEMKFNIEGKILKSIASEYFLESLKKANKQYNYMIEKEKPFDKNRYINFIFNLLSEELGDNVA